MAIDEIAERVTEECCTEAGDIAFYSEDRGYVEIGTPRAILVIDPVDGTRPAAAGFEACCVSVAVLPPSRDATLGDVELRGRARDQERAPFLRNARRGRYLRARLRRCGVDRALGERRSAQAVLRVRCTRPAVGCNGGAARGSGRRLLDARRLLRPRLLHLRHDAHRHRPARRVRRSGFVARSTHCRSSSLRSGARARAGSAATSRTTSRLRR